MSYTDCNRMPGIVRVMWLRAEQITPHVAEKYVAGVPVAIGAQGNELRLVTNATAKGITTYENNGLVGECTLEFKTMDSVPMDEDVVWVVQDAEGHWWLIGARERNYPVTEVSSSAGSPGGDPAVSTVKVTHKAVVAIIPVAL